MSRRVRLTLTRVAVAGAGAWGTALAITLARAGRQTLLWTRRPELAQALVRDGCNRAYLPDTPLPPEIEITADAARLRSCDAVLLALPAQHLAQMLAALRPLPMPLVICAKGIERGTLRLVTEIVSASLPEAEVAVLSGPTFAAEVAAGLPAAVVLAVADVALGEALAEAIGTRSFRPYLSDDLTGVAIGGAVKNIMAIACGIVEGRRLGDNARAALLTRGLTEMVRLAVAKGARAETLMGLSGLGDLMLTATASQSRNYSLGFGLGQGRSLPELMQTDKIVEGVFSAEAVSAMAEGLGVEMPIVDAVSRIVSGAQPIDAAIEGLLARPFRRER